MIMTLSFGEKERLQLNDLIVIIAFQIILLELFKC